MYIHAVYTGGRYDEGSPREDVQVGQFGGAAAAEGAWIKEGVEMKVREEQGRYVVEPIEAPKKQIDLSFLDGRTAGLKLLRPEDREIEPSRY